MGQTLTHGIYLPDEGERNCYNGLAGNWQLLDGAVGTVAEHSTQIAGKASASHTHGNITNDGKLATASKALVTDSNKNITTSSVSDTELGYLSGVTSAIQTQLNAKAADSDVVHKSGNESIAGEKTFSENMYLNANTARSFNFKNSNYTAGQAAPASGTNDIDVILFKDSTDSNIGIVGLYDSSLGASYLRLLARNKFSNGARDTAGTVQGASLDVGLDNTGKNYISVGASRLEPSNDNQFSLGTSSKKWKDIYSSNYYYGTTAWGLDKANTWTGSNTYLKTLYVDFPEVELGVSPSDNVSRFIAFRDKNAHDIGYVQTRIKTNGESYIQFKAGNKYTNGSLDPNGTEVFSQIYVGTSVAGEPYVTFDADSYPERNNTYNLGTSTAKWKTLNGINPGALSLPSNSYTGSIAITEIDRTGWVYDGTVNTYSPPVDCWLSISNGGSITVWGINTAFGMKATDNIAIPLRQGETYNISLTNTPDFCRIYPCMGNV